MKKRIFGVVLAASLVASLAACGKSDNNNTQETTQESTASSESTVNTEISAEDYAGTIAKNAQVYKDYITLPEYKGVSVAVDKSELDVSADEVNDYIESLRNKYADKQEITEGQTAKGDTIKLSYKGLLDGQEFEGGSATDQTYTVGSGQFISDLDAGLEGLTLGEQHDIPCKFPDDYSKEDLAGKDVVFQVTVSAIEKTIIPDLTDEWVSSKASQIGMDATTVDGLRQAVKDKLATNKKSQFDSTKYKTLWSTLSAQIEVKGYPEEELNSLVSTLKSNIQTEFEQKGSQYECESFSDYVTKVYGFESEDAFNNYATEYSQKYLLEKMAITIIANNENITVTADDIKDMGNQLAVYYGLVDYDTLIQQYGNELNAELGYEELYQKVQTFLNDNAVETDAPAEDSSEATDSTTQSAQ